MADRASMTGDIIPVPAWSSRAMFLLWEDIIQVYHAHSSEIEAGWEGYHPYRERPDPPAAAAAAPPPGSDAPPEAASNLSGHASAELETGIIKSFYPVMFVLVCMVCTGGPSPGKRPKLARTPKQCARCSFYGLRHKCSNPKLVKKRIGKADV